MQRRVLPEPVQVPAVPVEAVDVDAAVSTAAAEEVACVVLDLSFEERDSGLTATVLVTKVVPPQTKAAPGLEEDEAATATVVFEEVVLELAPPRVEAATLVPSTATAVKLEKPCATMT